MEGLRRGSESVWGGRGAGASVELMSIQKMTSVIAETQQTRIHSVLQQSQIQAADLQRTVEHSMAHVELLKNLVGGFFAMELLDRILGLHYVCSLNPKPATHALLSAMVCVLCLSVLLPLRGGRSVSCVATAAAHKRIIFAGTCEVEPKRWGLR